MDEESAYVILSAASKSPLMELKVDDKINRTVNERQRVLMKTITDVVPHLPETMLPFAFDWMCRKTFGVYYLTGVYSAVRASPALFE